MVWRYRAILEHWRLLVRLILTMISTYRMNQRFLRIKERIYRRFLCRILESVHGGRVLKKGVTQGARSWLSTPITTCAVTAAGTGASALAFRNTESRHARSENTAHGAPRRSVMPNLGPNLLVPRSRIAWVYSNFKFQVSGVIIW